MPDVATGLDLLREEGGRSLRGRRVGLLCHPASVTADLVHAVKVLRELPGVELCALFGPQHGLRGETQDNMVEWEGFTDPATGLPVHSLYGEHRRPTPDMLDGLDVLVVDLQDVGARYYTFVWTVLLCLEACADAGVAVTVLDRPNPVGGLVIEGNLPDPDYRSFVGLWPLPMRHGLTLGELARLLAAEKRLDVALSVVPLRGWRRGMLFADTGLPWVLPSPNMPTPDTALVYPGMCLLEGTTLSEGRGTTRPFELAGAPGIDPDRLAARLAAWELPGAAWRPTWFQPTFQKHAGAVCGGVQLHVTDPRAFRAVLAAVALLCAARELFPDAWEWREPPYEYEFEKLPIDILAGGSDLREAVDAGADPREIVAAWERPLPSWWEQTEEYRLYA